MGLIMQELAWLILTTDSFLHKDNNRTAKLIWFSIYTIFPLSAHLSI